MKMNAYETVLNQSLLDSLQDLGTESGAYTFQVTVNLPERTALAISGEIEIVLTLPLFSDEELREHYVCVIKV